jgi:hypothetical protein
VHRLRNTPLKAKPTAFAEKAKVPLSCISLAASRKAPKARRVSAEPVLTRLTPAAAASSVTPNVTPGMPMTTLNGLVSELQTWRIRPRSCRPGA